MSASTPNFSRPLPSPYEEMTSPSRTPQTARHIAKGAMHSPSQSLVELTNRRQTLGGSLSSSQLSVNEFLKDTFRSQKNLDCGREDLTAQEENTSGCLLKSTPRGHVRRLSRASTISNRSSTNSTQPAMDRPIQHFRPMLWKHLDINRDKLNLDLFWPHKIEDLHDPDYDEETNIFSYNDMKPLCQFRRLRSLQLNGMMRSYQRIIWQCVWMNLGLQTLTLEMALGPEVEEGSTTICKEIKRGWKHSENEGSSEYLGAHGEGVLHEEFGLGEYLDKQAITLAERDVFGPAAGEAVRYLPIRKLVLMGFAVDAGPFYRCFNPMKLREVVFKENCFDVGFTLPPKMRRVKVTLGGVLDEPICLSPGAAKLITLKKGEKVPEPTTTLREKFSGILRQWKSKDS